MLHTTLFQKLLIIQPPRKRANKETYPSFKIKSKHGVRLFYIVSLILTLVKQDAQMCRCLHCSWKTSSPFPLIERQHNSVNQGNLQVGIARRGCIVDWRQVTCESFLPVLLFDGFLLPSSFFCLSSSSLWWLMISCCLIKTVDSTFSFFLHLNLHTSLWWKRRKNNWSVQRIPMFFKV